MKTKSKISEKIGEDEEVISDDENKEIIKKDSKLSEYSKYDDDHERRKLRQEYRELYKVIEENAQEIIKPDSEKIGECLKSGEELFSKVRRPREAVHDSAYLLTLTKRSREQAQELKSDVISFDNNTFIQKLISLVNGYDITGNSTDDDTIDLPVNCWEEIGKKASSLFKKAPVFDFLLGPLVLEVEITEKKSRNRQKDDVQGAIQKLKSIENVDKQEEATTKEVERILKILKHKSSKGKERIPFFPFIVNPESFGQTIENLFHFAFLIKDGRAIIELDDDGLPTVNLHKQYREEEHEEQVPRKQVVMPMTMINWQELIDVYDIQKATIPTRERIH